VSNPSIQFSTAWFGRESAPWWIAAGAATAYQWMRGLRDRAHLPLRVTIAALAVSLAIMVDGGLSEYWKMLCLLGVAGALQIASLRTQSNLLSNLAALQVLGIALHSLNISISRSGAGVVMLGLLTFSALLMLSHRPHFAAPAVEGAAPEPGMVRRALLVVLGSLLKVPFVAMIFFWARTFFTWLRYMKSPGEPLGTNDFLYAAAHLYGAMLLSTQVELHLLAHGYARDYVSLVLAYLFSVWGLVLVLQGLRTGQIYQRVLGLAFILVLSILSTFSRSPMDFNLGGTLFGIGLVTALACWLILRAVGEAPAAPGGDSVER